jgi:hypothetical protein
VTLDYLDPLAAANLSNLIRSTELRLEFYDVAAFFLVCFCASVIDVTADYLFADFY